MNKDTKDWENSLFCGLQSVTVWVMREVIGNGWERRSGQKRELRANERSPKTGNRPKVGKLQNQVNQVKQVEKSDFAIFLLKKRCCYDQVVMQQDSTLSTTSIVFWWILFTLCTEISSQIVVEWIIVQLIWLFVVDNFAKWLFSAYLNKDRLVEVTSSILILPISLPWNVYTL